ncbi:nitroreductase [Anaeromyxobacter dehalogenans 2CP-1]|uniref:Nitroreductase n=1 Tax=Anaeromyxobacter dehalogenans (strain ATCC BAA-258 / DSM 21875 / 2CP-1) TaxID=455488 RepID=B8J693_ANAD2|nr:nitroreductase family protein [Anaeromyxobacter dehalogenans]ACL65074.1 nitroreductase [Anaeromyxobacter dehalogenans 2CP-1]
MTTVTATPTAAATARRPEHPIDAPFLARWSPRAFTDEAIPRDTLLGLLEAARWAPSAMNAQPWRFAWARRGTPAFDRFLSALAPANQAWARNAAALVAVASREAMELPGRPGPVPNASHAFDAGAAWAQLALQAQRWGWATHAMGGFDAARAREALALPDGLALHAFVAIGRRGDAAALPEALRARERPSDRLPLSALAFEGGFEGAGT